MATLDTRITDDDETTRCFRIAKTEPELVAILRDPTHDDDPTEDLTEWMSLPMRS